MTPIIGVSNFPQAIIPEMPTMYNIGHGNENNATTGKGPGTGEGTRAMSAINPRVTGGHGLGTRTAWDTAAVDPLQHTGWSGAAAGAQNFAIHTPGHDQGGNHEDGNRQGDIPRDNGEIHFNRNREKGLETFDGKAAEFRPWRRRMVIYTMEEN